MPDPNPSNLIAPAKGVRRVRRLGWPVTWVGTLALVVSLLSLVLVFVLLVIVDRIARRVSALSLGRA